MRTFIAIEMTELKDFFFNLQKKIDKEAKINFTKNFHLTLKFLGDIDEEKSKKVKKLLGEIKFNKFRIKTSLLGVFPNENYIRVIWIGLESEKIIELQKAIDEKLRNFFPRDKRFHPHLTLGRVKFVKDKERFIQNYKNIEVEQKEFEVKNFKLKKSTLTPQGSVYEDLEIYEF